MSLVLEPIGTLRGGPASKFLAPSQPADSHGWVELRPELEPALQDLEGFSHIWLIWWFHRNTGWRARVLPPQGRSGRKGLFATRSPHRPCPLGLSAVRLLGISGPILWLGEHDLVEGTPILDIKPYLARFDSIPEAAAGWFGDLPVARWEVRCAPLAERQLAWLDQHHDPMFSRRVKQTLAADPLPHRTRRIMRLPDGGLRMACGDYRVYFRLCDEQAHVERVAVRDGARAPQHEAFRQLT